MDWETQTTDVSLSQSWRLDAQGQGVRGGPTSCLPDGCLPLASSHGPGEGALVSLPIMVPTPET